jgi:hypothetical protein
MYRFCTVFYKKIIVADLADRSIGRSGKFLLDPSSTVILVPSPVELRVTFYCFMTLRVLQDTFPWVSQKIVRLSWDSIIQYRASKSSPLGYIVSQMNPIHALGLCMFHFVHSMIQNAVVLAKL